MKYFRLLALLGCAAAWAVVMTLLFAPEPAPAQVRISTLPSAAPLSGSELLPIVQAGANATTTPSALLTYIQAHVSVSGASIYGTPTAGHCAEWYSATQIEDAGAACGSGSSGALLAANNLSDLASAATARTNLGLGTAATQASSAFDAAGAASAAQGASLQKANNLSDLASASSARTNLGLGSAATQASGAFDAAGAASAAQGASLQKANNLSDLASVTSALANLGVTAVGTASATNGLTLAMMAQAPANTIRSNPTGSTANVQDQAVPSCSAAGSFLQYVSGTGLRCLTPAAPLAVTPSNPASTTSTTLVMAGIGSTAVITPAATGRLRITVNGDIYNTTAAVPVAVGLYGGTGTAPSNGAAASGYTALGNPVKGRGSGAAAGYGLPFSLTWVVTGLTVGTAYWIDLGMATTNASYATNLENLSVTATEF